MKSTFAHRLMVLLSRLALISWLLITSVAVPRASFSAPQATTWYVAPSGSDLNDCLSVNTACEHIQTAINRSSSGDTIIIAAGTYFETLEISDKSLTLTGQGAATTIIDGLQQGTVLSILANTPCVVNIFGLTLRNGQSSIPGGGISAESKVSLTVLDTNIINNTAAYGGGLFNQGQLSLNNVLLNNNQATSPDISEGGGIWNTGTGELNGVTLVNNVASRGGGISNLNVMTITTSVIGNNRAVGSYGGGIYNHGGASQLTLLDSTVSGNRAIGTNGGGVYNDNIFISSGTIFSGNLAISHGGGVFNSASGKVTFSNGTLRNNTAQADEGGALFNAGTATFDNTAINNNLAGAGGGVYNAGGAQLTIETSNIGPNTAANQTGGGINNLGSLTMLQSALVYNTASVAPGGGLYNAGTAELTNVTISDNTATGGGGLQNDGGTVQIKFSTISNNTGAPALNNTSSTVTIANSILTQNIGTVCGGIITSQGYNLESGNTCVFTATGDLTNTAPLLGSLRNNGGPTPTMTLLPDSPAIDAGDTIDCPATDQRGVPRPLDGDEDGNARCDIGAVELSNVSVSDVTIDGPARISVDTSATFIATVIPISATQPITYVWEATDFAPVIHGGGISNTHNFTWSVPGAKTLTVTASNATGVATNTYSVLIGMPPNTIKIEGPTTGQVNSTYAFTAAVNPLTVTQPITYVWEATDLAPVIHIGGISTTHSFAWSVSGTKAITVTASNATGVATSTYSILIGVPPNTVKVEGPVTGLVNSTYAFTAAVNPLTVTQPITYVWSTSDHSSLTTTNGITDTIVLSWTTYATHVVTVTVSNGFGISLPTTRTIAIEPCRIYLPLILR